MTTPPPEWLCWRFTSESRGQRIAMTELFRVKTLEWEWLTVNGIKFLNADSAIGNLNWRIYQLTTGWHLNPSGRSGIDCASPEEGKQLAEQHWREYVTQALVPVETER